MKLSVAILISGSGSNMVQLVKSMDHEHPAFPSVIISNKSDAQGLEKALLEVQKGTSETVVVNYIISQLKENVVFWEIFSKNNIAEVKADILEHSDDLYIRVDN